MDNENIKDDKNSALRVCPCKDCKTSMPIQAFINLFNGTRIVVGYHDEKGNYIQISKANE